MDCYSNHYKSQSCGCMINNAIFWSKKKKLEILKSKLECLQRQKDDINDAIEEIENS